MDTKDIVAKANEQLARLELESGAARASNGKSNGSPRPKTSTSSAIPSADPKRLSSRKSSEKKFVFDTQPPPEPPKKVPMNKVKVGLTPSPNLKEVRSKVGSVNSSYKKPESKIKIEDKKTKWQGESKIGSLKNVTHVAGGGNVKIESKKLEVRAKSKIGSLQNIGHKPGGGDVKIYDEAKTSASGSGPVSPTPK